VPGPGRPLALTWRGQNLGWFPQDRPQEQGGAVPPGTASGGAGDPPGSGPGSPSPGAGPSASASASGPASSSSVASWRARPRLRISSAGLVPSRKRRKSAWSSASASASTAIEASATTSSSIQMPLPVRRARAIASLGRASSSLLSPSAVLSFITARKVLSSIVLITTRSRLRPPSSSSDTIRSWLRGRGGVSGPRPARMFWAWAWSIQIGTWRRLEGSRSSTIGLRLAASRAMPATRISTMVWRVPLFDYGQKAGLSRCSPVWCGPRG